MADYVNLNYTAAEINADLAKVHGVDAVVPEAPKDGLEYIRKGGNWVQNIKGVDTTIGDMLIEIAENRACSQEQYDYLIANVSEEYDLNYTTQYAPVYLTHAKRGSDGKINAETFIMYGITGVYSVSLTIKSDLSVYAQQSVFMLGASINSIDLSFTLTDGDAGSLGTGLTLSTNGTGSKYLSDNGLYQELYSRADIDSKIGDINTILDSINGEEV